MPMWAVLLILMVGIIIVFLLYCLMVAAGDYNRRCEDEDNRKQADYERRVREQREKMIEQNHVPEQKRDDSTWF